MPQNVMSPEEGSAMAELYLANTKHGTYHPVPHYVQPFIDTSELNVRWRDPQPRLELLLVELAQSNRPSSTVVELGANSGFQVLTLARHFPKRKFVAIEGNSGHAEFIVRCAEFEQLDNLDVLNDYLTPAQIVDRWQQPTVLDFNVAHHIGADFDFQNVHAVEDWWSRGLPSWLSGVDLSAEYYFSVGYRLGGDTRHDLHSPNDPSGMVNRLISALPELPGDTTVDVWGFGAGSDGRIHANATSIAQLNEALATSLLNGDFVGEYFKRPIVRIRPGD